MRAIWERGKQGDVTDSLIEGQDSAELNCCVESCSFTTWFWDHAFRQGRLSLMGVFGILVIERERRGDVLFTTYGMVISSYHLQGLLAGFVS